MANKAFSEIRMSSAQAFYAQGLKFECTRCNACCRHDPGYVFLSQKDLDRLCAHFKMDADTFRARYCRVVDFGLTKRLCLLEKPNYDCILWENGGCSAYEARPLQCRSFPFWPQTVDSREAWEEAGKSCPGINRGKVHGKAEIEAFLQARHSESLLEG